MNNNVVNVNDVIINAYKIGKLQAYYQFVGSKNPITSKLAKYLIDKELKEWSK